MSICKKRPGARPSPLFPYTTLFRSYSVDVADYDSCQACVAKVQSEVGPVDILIRSEEHTSELQSHSELVCRLLLEKKKNTHVLTDAEENVRQKLRAGGGV